MKKVYSLVAASAAVALTLTACSGSGKSDVAGANSSKPISFTVGADEYSGYNSFLSSTFSTGNSAVNDRMMMGFGFYDAEGKWNHGTALGDYEKVSDSPLTIKYTINEKAVYQGGTPITCEDFYMDWVAQNPAWIQEGQKAAGAVDENGNPAALFDHISASTTYADPVANGPECEAGDREFTVTYSAPNPDWELVISGVLPSHVVAKHLDMSKEDLFKALKNKDFEVAKKAADFWNNWYSKTAGDIPSVEDAPSWGPYTLSREKDAWKPGQYVTLVKNPDWWGEEPGVEQLVVKQMAPEAQMQALKNGDVNVIEPQATQDTIEQINAMTGVQLLQGDSMIWEHLDLNRGEHSVFSDTKGGKAMREAFAYCVPRQDIVDKLIKPLYKDAQVMNSREYFPFQKDYKDVVSKIYDGSYDKVDIEKAKALVAESGVANPVVRIGYSAGNQRRADEVALITASCAQAGITVEDISAGNFFQPDGALSTGDFDVALFAWSGSGQIASGANIYMSTGQQNYIQYKNDTVDAAWATIQSTLDPAVIDEKKIELEKALWTDLYNIPLFNHPGIAAYTEGLKNVERTVTQSGIMWNAEKWTWSAE